MVRGGKVWAAAAFLMQNWKKTLWQMFLFFLWFFPHFYQLGISVVCLCLVDCMSHGREDEVNLLWFDSSGWERSKLSVQPDGRHQVRLSDWISTPHTVKGDKGSSPTHSRTEAQTQKQFSYWKKFPFHLKNCNGNIWENEASERENT